MPRVMSGLELARRFYLEAVLPIVESAYPGLAHSAARIGRGSEVLGFGSHAGVVAVHIHHVVQPVTAQQMAEFGTYGPSLQVPWLRGGETPPGPEIQRVAEQARAAFTSR